MVMYYFKILLFEKQEHHQPFIALQFTICLTCLCLGTNSHTMQLRTSSHPGRLDCSTAVLQTGVQYSRLECSTASPNTVIRHFSTCFREGFIWFSYVTWELVRLGLEPITLQEQPVEWSTKDSVQLESEGQRVRYRVLGLVGSKFMD